MRSFFNWAKCLAFAIMTVNPSLLKGQDLISSIVSSDNLYIYSQSYSSSDLYGSKGPVEQVFLSTVSDELIIKKKTDVSQVKVAEAISNNLPSAQIGWVKNHDDVCMVIADKNDIETCIADLISNDDIISIRPGYIRRVYVDLMKLYPVCRVATYGFDDQIYVELKSEFSNEAQTLIESLGFRTELTPDSNTLTQFIYVPKESDILSIANTLYESGYFISSRPSSHIVVRDIEVVPFDKTDLDFYYNLDGSKHYLYKSPGRFIIKKGKDTDKAVIESVLSKYLVLPSYVWATDNLCKVDIDESLVDDAIDQISKEESVLFVSRSYLMPSEYEKTIVEGTDYPKDYNYDENITIRFIDGVPESRKDSLKNALNLKMIEENVAFSTWAVNSTDDILHICRELYESGYLKCATPNWVNGFKIIWWSSPDPETTIRETTESSIVSVLYFDMLGRPVNNPSGLTIVVTRYSDGTIRTEKKLFR